MASSNNDTPQDLWQFDAPELAIGALGENLLQQVGARYVTLLQQQQQPPETEGSASDGNNETEEEGEDEEDDSAMNIRQEGPPPSSYRGKRIQETRLRYSKGHSRQVLDQNGPRLGLTGCFGNNRVVAVSTDKTTGTKTKVSHFAIRDTNSVLPYTTSYPLQYTGMVRRQVTFLQATRNNPAPTVPIFWSSTLRPYGIFGRQRIQ